jgi:ectoine hydroxylase
MDMTLTDRMMTDYRELGYITLPGAVDPDGVAELRKRAAELTRRGAGPERILEPDGETVRTIFNVHELDPFYAEVATCKAVMGTARELLGEDVYVLQTQLNPKPGFDTVAWRWHSDYLFWHTRDGMLQPRVLTATVYLHDVTPYNGAILAVPRSHLKTVWEVAEEGENLPCGVKDGNSAPSHTVIRELAEENGLEYLTGSAGSVMFLDAQTLHCSSANQSPFDRGILIIRFNAVGNPLPAIANPRANWKVKPTA